MCMKNVVIGVLIIAILGVGLVVGILLVNQQAVFKQKAASSTGTATVSIMPAQSSFERNTSYPISNYFNTKSTSISGVSVRILFSNLGVTAANIQIGSNLLSDGNWSCPVKSISSSGSTSQIDINCVTAADAGFSSTTDMLLATFNLTATEVPIQNPLIVSFDAQNSTVTQKSSGQDILLTPVSTGSYTITDTIAQSPTPTPLVVIASTTPTPLGT